MLSLLIPKYLLLSSVSVYSIWDPFCAVPFCLWKEALISSSPFRNVNFLKDWFPNSITGMEWDIVERRLGWLFVVVSFSASCLLLTHSRKSYFCLSDCNKKNFQLWHEEKIGFYSRESLNCLCCKLSLWCLCRATSYHHFVCVFFSFASWLLLTSGGIWEGYAEAGKIMAIFSSRLPRKTSYPKCLSWHCRLIHRKNLYRFYKIVLV